LRVAHEAAAGAGDLLRGAGELEAVEFDDGVVEGCDVTVEERLGAEFAVDGLIAGDDAANDGVLRKNEVIGKVDRLGENAGYRSSDVEMRGVGDANTQRNVNR
jgi:hypothetical protein